MSGRFLVNKASPSRNQLIDSQFNKTWLWEAYNQAKRNGEHVQNQTNEFFLRIPRELATSFPVKAYPVMQFGISDGEFLAQTLTAPIPRVIGYEYAQTALTQLNKLGFECRDIDLNQLDSDNSKKLAYHETLKEDLAEPVNFLAIRILEYLNPDVVTVLLLSLIELSKPGSIFYLEMSHVSEQSESSIPFKHPINPGYVPSFFGPRADISFKHWGTRHNEEIEPGTDQKSVSEQFIAIKYR